MNSRDECFEDGVEVYCAKVWQFRCANCGEMQTLEDDNFDIMKDMGESSIPITCPVCMTNLRAFRE